MPKNVACLEVAPLERQKEVGHHIVTCLDHDDVIGRLRGGATGSSDEEYSHQAEASTRYGKEYYSSSYERCQRGHR